MPVNYDGDKTNTQAPSAAPEPEATITQAIPVDGDDVDASTFEQAFKVCADFIDWLFKPAAKASAWVGHIMAWRTAADHKRFAIDHLGFPAGQVLVHDVVWKSSPIADHSSRFDPGESFFPIMPEWRYKATESVSLAGTNALMTRNDFGPILSIQPGEGAGDYTTVSSGEFGEFRADNHVALSFTAAKGSSATRKFIIALCGQPTHHPDVHNDWIGFRADPTGNWFCITKAGGSETATDSGVAVNTGSGRPDRLRVEWHGESVSDDGNRRVRFFINGAIVATHSANLPVDTAIGICISDVRTSAGAGGGGSSVGPMKLGVSLHNTDTVL